MNFRDARHLARMTVADVASYLNISPSTVKRYDNTGIAPKAVIECLRMIGGKFPDIAIKRNGFYGWSFGQGFLWSPGGDRYTSGDILASRFDRELADSLFRKFESERKQEIEKKESAVILPFPTRNRLDAVKRT